MITIPGKIPITIHPLFWLLAAFIGWMSTFTLMGTLLAIIVIIISVLFHEFGHALTGVLFKQKTRIELAVFGGFTYRQGPKLKLWQEFFVVLNGPLAGLTLCGLSYLILVLVQPTNPSFLFMVQFAVLVNLFWTILNLIPVLPLDGGHLMSIALEAIFGFRGIKMAIFIGLIVSVAITIFFFVVGRWLIGAIFLILTFESFRSLRYTRLLTEKDRDENLQGEMKKASDAFASGNELEAIESYHCVRKKTGKGVLYTMATKEVALIYKVQGRIDEAYELLLSIKKELAAETLVLFHLLAFQTKHYENVVLMAKEAYQLNPSDKTALINALSYAALAQTKPAVGWFECALRDGLKNSHEALAKPEFDPIRQEEAFRRFES